VRRKVLQQHPLRARQHDDVAIAQHKTAVQVDRQASDVDLAARSGRGGCAAQQCAHPRAQFVGAERLGKVVVGA
jgi:hypothetical protein